jgi:hypothetical protein
MLKYSAGAEKTEPVSACDFSIRRWKLLMLPHYYFNLTNGHEVIPDEIGIEVSDARTALIHAFEAIEELRREADTSQSEWEGWRLNIVDGSGRLIHSLPLDHPPLDLNSHN